MSKFLLTSFFIFTLGCSLNTSIEKKDTATQLENDFEKTQIIAGSAVPADGFSQLPVAIHLKNSNNNPVSNFTPTYTVEGTDANQVDTSSCSSSDSNGASICILKSTKEGSFSFVLTNAKVGLTKTIQFLAKTGNPNFNINSGSVINGTTPQDSKLQVELGTALAAPNQVTSGGYKINFQVE